MVDYIQLSQITKFYGPRKVLDQVSFTVKKGTLVAVVGENGAGKSTLMNILGGLTPSDHGQLQLAGIDYKPKSAEDAFQKKIGYVHQHFLLAENLTALQNLILNSTMGSFSLRPLSAADVQSKTNQLLKQFNWNVNLDSIVSKLSVGDQQRIEILKSLLQDPDILILDEPTAVLSPIEIEKFLDFILELKKLEKTIFLITHKLPEVEKVADQIVVLRGGNLVHDSLFSKTSRSEISEKIIGQNLVSKNLTVNDQSSQTRQAASKTRCLIPGTQIELRHHEIFGVAGVEGNGQTELIESILSEVKNKKISFADITEDRLKKGVFPGLTLTEHMILRHQKAFSRYGFTQNKKAKLATDQLVTEWNVRPADSQADIMSLSGGNQQKFVVGKELWHDPEFILAAHPTRGLDIGAQDQIHQSLNRRSQQGKTIFLVTADLDEVLKLSDRYVILYKQKIFGPFTKTELTEKEIGEYMTGLKQ